MSRRYPAAVLEIPAWAKPDAPHRCALWEVAALVGFEGVPVRMSAADQRAIMGGVVFGKQAFTVQADGTVRVVRATCFGMDSEAHDYTPARVNEATAAGKRLSPGMFGPAYLG